MSKAASAVARKRAMAGQARVCGPRKAGHGGVRLYVEGGNPRRTPLIGKITIYEWKQTNYHRRDHGRIVWNRF